MLLSLMDLQRLATRMKSLSDHQIIQELLQITPSATEKELMFSFRKKSLIYHPDRYHDVNEKVFAAEIFKRLSHAKDQFFSENRASTQSNDFFVDAIMTQINALPKNIRAPFVQIHGGAFTRNLMMAGISLKELCALDPDVRYVILDGIGSAGIIFLEQIGVHLSDMVKINPTSQRDFLIRHGESLSTLITRAGIPLTKIITIEQSKLLELFRFTWVTIYILIEANVPLDDLLALSPDILGKLLAQLISDEVTDRLSTSTISLTTLLNVEPITAKEALLCSLYAVMILVDEVNISLNELIQMDSAVRSECLTYASYLKILVKDMRIPWSYIKSLELSDQIALVDENSSGLLTALLVTNKLNLSDFFSMDSENRSYFLHNVRMYYHCLTSGQLSFSELMALNPSAKVALFQTLDDVAKELESYPNKRIRSELYCNSNLYILASIKSEVQGLLNALVTINKPEREKLYAQWPLIQKLVKDGRVSGNELAVLASMNIDTLAQLEHPSCLQALFNGDTCLNQLATMTTQELELANQMDDYTVIKPPIDNTTSAKSIETTQRFKSTLDHNNDQKTQSHDEKEQNGGKGSCNMM